MRASRTTTKTRTAFSPEILGSTGSQGAFGNGVPSGRHQVSGPEGKEETPTISMRAPLDRLRTHRRSPAGLSFGFSAGCTTTWGGRAARISSFGACCDRAWAVRPTATRVPTATSLSFSHIIIFRTPSVRSKTAAVNAPGAHAVATRAVDRTSCWGTAARASRVSTEAIPATTVPGARPRCASLARNLSRPLVSRLLTVATGQSSCRAAWS